MHYLAVSDYCGEGSVSWKGNDCLDCFCAMGVASLQLLGGTETLSLGHVPGRLLQYLGKLDTLHFFNLLEDCGINLIFL